MRRVHCEDRRLHFRKGQHMSGIETCARELEAAGWELCEKLARARSISCVDARFAEFFGSGIVHEAHLMAAESLKNDVQLKRACRQGFSWLYSEGKTWNHCLAKPFGYPGDFAVLEMVYDQRPHPETKSAAAIFSDVWGLSQELPRAVAARKDALRSYLEDVAGQTNDGRLKVLSVAAGGARELRDMLPSLFSRLDVTLLDSDPRALRFAESGFTDRIEAPALATVVGDAVRGQGGYEPQLTAGGPFNLIYSFGLFDYLKDEYLVGCVRRFLPYLADGGKFLFCLKDRRYYDAWVYDWFYDWKFVPRTIDDGPRLAADLGLKVTKTLIIEGRTIGIFVCERS